jgi:hypothetical protein
MVIPDQNDHWSVGVRSQCSWRSSADSGTHPGSAEILSHHRRYTHSMAPAGLCGWPIFPPPISGLPFDQPTHDNWR